jgi:hypothetical protein
MRLNDKFIFIIVTGLFLLCGTNACLAQENKTAQASSPAPAAEEIPDAYIDEADDFLKYCQATPRFRQFYNCECLAASFLGERIKQGPEMNRSTIMLNIEDECADGTEVSGEAFKTCVDRPSLLPPGTDPVKHCECFANTYAKLYERNPGTGTKDTIKLQSQAHLTCSNPELAKRMYPNG